MPPSQVSASTASGPDLDVLALGMMMGEVSPRQAGTTVSGAPELMLFPSGSTIIFAIALARLGARVGVVSRVGDDELGRWMTDALARAGIDGGGVSAVAGQLTPLALASVDGRGRKSYSFYRFAGTCDPLATLRAADVPDETLRRARVFDVGEASLRSPALRGEALALMDRARALGLAVCYTPNYRASSWAGGAEEAIPAQRAALSRSTVTMMNAEEARLLSGEATAEAAIHSLASLGPRAVAVTNGAEEALLLTDGALLRLPVVPAEVVFDIGAGDTFHAGYLAAMTAGADPPECARFALHAAALKISRPPDPALLPTRDDVLRAMAAQ
ncbi:MAG: carbohydrate kinase family protein [Chloroflexota bacterium]